MFQRFRHRFGSTGVPHRGVRPVLGAASRTIRTRAAAHPALLTAGVGVAALVVWAITALLAWFVYDVTGRAEAVDLQVIGHMPRATTVFDAEGEPVFSFATEQRIEIPLSEVSPHLVRAVLAVEDQRFHEHGGVDLIRIAGAALANARQGRAVQGGSTITQQLARQSFLTREKTIHRKLKELVLAARIERALSKEQILELYLNKVYFGNGLYGVEAAARGYLGKRAADLDAAEAALLAGLIRSPSTYAPTANMDLALARRNLVLRALLSRGEIDRETYERGRQARVRLRNTLRADEGFGLYFKEQVRRELVERFGWKPVYEGGLRVFTTLDRKAQQAADKLVQEHLTRIERQPRFPHPSREKTAAASDEADASTPYLQGALVAMDAATGHVVAMVGGRDFRDSHFNRAVQARRQAGSAFKPFIYAAALEAGFTPATLVTDLDEPVPTPEGDWVPEDERSTAAEMTVRDALRVSSNRAAVRVLEAVGIRRAVDYVERLNLGELPAVPSIALGSGSVTLVDMVGAFGAFANGGLVQPPILIQRVEDAEGAVLFEASPAPRRAISRTTAFLMASMLSDVISAGTAYRARQAGFTLPAAGKTGTTNDFKDAWFVGFTPSIVAGVWIGFDQPRTIMPNGYGGELAAPLWGAFMKVVTRGHRPVGFERPPEIVAIDVCRYSGRRPADGCHAVDVVNDEGWIETRSAVYTEYFARGTEPAEVCHLHARRSLWQRIAGVFGGGSDERGTASSGDAGDGSSLDLRGAPVPQPVPQPWPQAPAPDPRVEAPRPDPASATATAGDDGEPAERAEQPKKKRGFWSRLFGRGRDKDEDDPRPPRRPPGKPH